jgi:hypothetical protein
MQPTGITCHDPALQCSVSIIELPHHSIGAAPGKSIEKNP